MQVLKRGSEFDPAHENPHTDVEDWIDSGAKQRRFRDLLQVHSQQRRQYLPRAMRFEISYRLSLYCVRRHFPLARPVLIFLGPWSPKKTLGHEKKLTVPLQYPVIMSVEVFDEADLSKSGARECFHL